MKEIILGTWLGIQGIIDFKYKKIPLCLSVAGAILGVVFSLVEGRAFREIGFSVVPGILALLFAKITKEILGYGDGIVFLVMGLYLNLEQLLSVVLLSFVLAGFVGIILLVIFKKNKDDRIPFLPFLGVAYWIEFGFIVVGGAS